MNKSLWPDFVEAPKFSTLDHDIDCEILVIGGGLSGVLTAYLLSCQGHDVVLAERETLGRGTTARTTAVITAQHDTKYAKLIKMHGKNKTKAYLRANLQAVNAYRKIAGDLPCDFENKPSFMYSVTSDLREEVRVLNDFGFPAQLLSAVDLPFQVKSAVYYPDMAQFNPLKFLYLLAENFQVYEHTFIKTIHKNEAFTDNYRIGFKMAVIATHFPFINRSGLYFAKLFQQQSYVAAVNPGPNVGGTYIDDTGKGFYFRNYGPYLIIGAGASRTGTKNQTPETLARFIALHYPDAKIDYFWSNQDCMSLDKIPYIGKYGRFENIYVASGFNMWGMTGSMVSAQILTDLLADRKNPYSAVFNPQRSLLRKQLFLNLGSTVKNFVWPTRRRCSHMGCALKYDSFEHSWTCPCHGSSFDLQGNLVENPTRKNIKHF